MAFSTTANIADATGPRGPAFAMTLRSTPKRWAGHLVREVRSGQIHPAPDSALQAAAALRYVDGRPVPERAAAVALLNVVRPTIAVAWFIACAGMALHEHPDWRNRISGGDEAALDLSRIPTRPRSGVILELRHPSA